MKQLYKYTTFLSSVLDQQTKSAKHLRERRQQPCILELQMTDALLLLYSWIQQCRNVNLQDVVRELLCDMSSIKIEFTSNSQTVNKEVCNSAHASRKDCAKNILKICCNTNLKKSLTANNEEEKTDRIMKVLHIFLTFFHLYCPKTRELQQRVAKWLHDSLVIHVPYVVNVLLSPGSEVGRSIVYKILALYEAPQSDTEHNPNGSKDDDHQSQICK